MSRKSNRARWMNGYQKGLAESIAEMKREVYWCPRCLWRGIDAQRGNRGTCPKCQNPQVKNWRFDGGPWTPGTQRPEENTMTVRFQFTYSVLTLGDLELERVPGAVVREISDACKALWENKRATPALGQNGWSYKVKWEGAR